MHIKVFRRDFTNVSSIGEMYLLDYKGQISSKSPDFYTLEDRIRKNKVKGKTAIPSGQYEVVLTYSNRFGKVLPLLLNVPNFEGVRIHTGNTAEDTEGCILIGSKKGRDVITESKIAFRIFMFKLERALKKGKVYIEIQ